MLTNIKQETFRNLGDASFYVSEYHFDEKKIGEIHEYIPPTEIGQGAVYQLQPTNGMFVSVGDWIPYQDMERQYELDLKMIKIYYLESGCVRLIQNGKRATTIQEGINLYLNRPFKGRVKYQADTPIRYVSVLLLEEYFSVFLQESFIADDFDYAKLFSWHEFDYNTPEIGRIFLQIKEKILSNETSSLYYESKIGELLSIIGGNFRRQKQHSEININPLSSEEQKAMERVRMEIERNILHPPTSEELCRIAAMGHTKFRQSFRQIYGMSPYEYVLQVRMRYARLLLSKQRLSIGEIARHLGYASASKFSIAFRKIHCHSPREYRKLLDREEYHIKTKNKS